MSTMPSPRLGAAFAYDEAAQCGYLFGGYSSAGYHDEVWQWKDGVWSGPLAVGSGPPPLDDLKAFYNPANEAILVTGGTAESGDYEDIRDRFVRQLWLWKGGSWSKLELVAGDLPPARFDQSVAFDKRRGRLVVYGGILLNAFKARDQDVWEFDGIKWTPFSPPSPAAAPSPDMYALMTFDAARGVVVMLGEDLRNLPNYEVWEWNGVTWRQRGSVALTFLLPGYRMVYDDARKRVVVFGSETLEWDGANWERFDGVYLPYNGTAVFDPVRGMIGSFGGSFGLRGEQRATNKIWERIGTQWKSPEPEPVRSEPHNIAIVTEDPKSGKIWALEFDKGADSVDWVWSFDGYSWQGPTDLPSALHTANPSIAFNALQSRLLVFGGKLSRFVSPDMAVDPNFWTFDGDTWDGPTTTQENGPGAREGHVLQYMDHVSAMMMFGGLGLNAEGRWEVKRDTWMASGSEWIRVAMDSGPPAPLVGRNQYKATYQLGRKKVLLVYYWWDDFHSRAFMVTWEFDGATWKLRDDTAHFPPPMREFELAYDRKRARAVLVGVDDTSYPGLSTEGPAPAANNGKQTWEWDGIDWSLIKEPSGALPSVPPTNYYRLAYSAAHKQVLWLGRNRGDWYSAETWAWDGARWSRLLL